MKGTRSGSRSRDGEVGCHNSTFRAPSDAEMTNRKESFPGDQPQCCRTFYKVKSLREGRFVFVDQIGGVHFHIFRRSGERLRYLAKDLEANLLEQILDIRDFQFIEINCVQSCCREGRR